MRESSCRRVPGEEEEPGTGNAEILAESRVWLFHDVPTGLIVTARHGPWRGQRQKWFAMRQGPDADINIITGAAEFSAWKGGGVEQLPDFIVPFKRHVYLINEFRAPAGPLKRGINAPTIPGPPASRGCLRRPSLSRRGVSRR
jgi:hypothetical protein